MKQTSGRRGPRSNRRPAQLAVATVAVLAGLVSGCGRDGVYPAGTNILLITVDTLRADHLSSYGYPRTTSPVLDRLAAEGVRFDQAAVQWPKTGPSFASMFTATYPKDNGIVRRVGAKLPLEFRMLAEVLKERGYTTHAVVSNGAVASEFHFDQGFDTYLQTWKLEGEGDVNGADAVNALARTVVAGLDRERPYFLWLHYLDPHAPYVPPPDWRDRFQDDEHHAGGREIAVREDVPRRQVGGIGAEQVLSGRRDLGFYVARYDAEIAYVDEKIGDILELLESEGLLRRTLTAFTSDHGESLGEHEYYFDHGRFSFQTCLRVPFIVHYPGVLPARVDERPVELIHLAPTVLEAAGVELEDGAWMQGRSLTARMLGTEPPPEGPTYAFSEAGYATEGRWQRVVRDERYKLIYAPFHPDRRWITGDRKYWFALFDLESDPAETVNLAHLQTTERDRLHRVMEEWLEAVPFDARVDASGPGEAADEMSPETRQQLEALGYL